MNTGRKAGSVRLRVGVLQVKQKKSAARRSRAGQQLWPVGRAKMESVCQASIRGHVVGACVVPIGFPCGLGTNW